MKEIIDKHFTQFWDIWYGQFKGHMTVDRMSQLIDMTKRHIVLDLENGKRTD